jgi:integrase
MTKANELTVLKVKNLTAPGHYVDGGGLYLQVTASGAKSWLFKYKVRGTKKRREMGLGPLRDVTLAEARDKALACRKQLAEALDPISVRHASLAATRLQAKSFKECATEYIAAHKAGWKNEKHGLQWAATLEKYAYPVIGSMTVRDIALPHILKILEPIWATTTETASRLRGRIESVLDWAAVRGYRDSDNPARWKGHLDTLLASPKKVKKVEHHKALDADSMPGFLSALRQQDGMGARALEFAILTAARSGEVRMATWDEFDLEAGVWNVPPDHMKAGREHRVPLSPAALKLLRNQARIEKTNLVFPSARLKVLSDMTLSAVMRRMKVAAVPHGFRSTFRDWVSERTSYPGEMAEMALAHAIGDKTEAAYRRGDLFEKRRRMMSDWAKFCATPTPAKTSKVLPMKKRA